MEVLQLAATRVGGVHEDIAILLLAAMLGMMVGRRTAATENRS